MSVRGIFGLENEYGLKSVDDGQHPAVDNEEIYRLLTASLARTGDIKTNLWLVNGARLYLDRGEHPEYATPECDSITQLVAVDKAGERVMEGLLAQANRTLTSRGQARAYLLKNNVDVSGTSYGCHENYLIPKTETSWEKVASPLIAFLVTRQLICGAGDILITPTTAHYNLSQRARFIKATVSSETMRDRPMISTREETHGDDHRFRRLHVILGDANMLEWSTFLKVGTTNLLLRLFREDPSIGRRFASLQLVSPPDALMTVAQDHRFSARLPLLQPFKTAFGSIEAASALEILWLYLRALEDHFQNEGGETEQILFGFRRVLEQFGSPDSPDPLHVVAPRQEGWVDWALKHTLLTRRMEKFGYPWSHPKLKNADLKYHTLERDRSEFAVAVKAMEASNLDARISTDEEINFFLGNAPPTTRARIRGEFLRRAQGSNKWYQVDWTTLTLKSGPLKRSVSLPDPFIAYDQKSEKLINALGTHARTVQALG